jgi:hypothetical protein
MLSFWRPPIASREAATLLSARGAQLAADVIAPGKEEEGPIEVARCLLVALDKRVTLDAAAVAVLANGLQIMAQRPALRTTSLQAPSSRALLIGFLRQRMSGASLDRGLELAAAFELKEAAEWPLVVAQDRARPGPLRGRALLTLAQVGAPEHATRLHALLSDEAVAGDRKLGHHTLHAQVRDVTLAVLIRLAGRQAADFGFLYLQAVPGLKALPSPSCLGFSSASERHAAFKKWADRAGSPK